MSEFSANNFAKIYMKQVLLQKLIGAVSISEISKNLFGTGQIALADFLQWVLLQMMICSWSVSQFAAGQ